MKKRVRVIVMSFLLCVLLSGCSKGLTKESVQLYGLSKSEKEVLQALKLQDRANVISFKATESVKGIEVHTYVLGKDNSWEENGYGNAWIDDVDDILLEGTFSMILNENYSIDFHIIDTTSKASYKTESIFHDKEVGVSSYLFLSQSKEVKLNEQIPVAIMVYDSGNLMRAISLDDYFDPQKFKDMDLVQAVVLEFTDDNN